MRTVSCVPVHHVIANKDKVLQKRLCMFGAPARSEKETGEIDVSSSCNLMA